MAEKLVPGIPHSTRIAILQQTDANEDEANDMGTAEQHVTVLEQVMSSDSSRNEVTRRMGCKCLTIGLVIKLSSMLTWEIFSQFYRRASRMMIHSFRSAQFAKFVMNKWRTSCFWPRRMQAWRVALEGYRRVRTWKLLKGRSRPRKSCKFQNSNAKDIFLISLDWINRKKISMPKE